MAKEVEIIVISSDDDEEISDRSCGGGNSTIDLTTSPRSYRLSTTKLNALKRSRKERNRLRSTANMHNSEITTITESRNEFPTSIKSLPSRLLQIDGAKLTRLRAQLRIHLERSPNTKSLIKKEKLDDDIDMLPQVLPSPPQSPAMKKKYPSPSPTQMNVLQYLKSSPKRKDLEDVFDEMTLSPSKIKTTPQKTQLTPQKSQLTPQKTQLTPQKTQSTLNHWMTPTKKMRKEVPTTPIPDVAAKRNELVWPPQHVILEPEKFIKRLYAKPREFPPKYENIVESLQDESLLITVVKTIRSFMSKDFAPSPELIWYLVDNILASSSNSWLVSSTYSLLNDIIKRYPTKCVAMNISLQHIRKYFFRDVEDSNDKKSKPCSKLALSFLLSVLSVELKTVALKSKQRRLTKYFSADFDIRHVGDIIPHLKKCLENHTATPNSCGIGESRDLPREASICGLELFQSLLKLFMIVSLNKENAAIRLADKLMYLYIELPNLQQRVLLLQSVTSHRVRQHLIKVLLMNYCSLLPDALKGHSDFLCVKKIVYQDFYREPPSRDESDGFGHSSDEVEEYITLLAYLLQSYLVMHSSSLHSYHNDYPLCDHDGVRELSQDDLYYLNELKEQVFKLRRRCSHFLREGQLLSVRTNLLLYMMEVVV